MLLSLIFIFCLQIELYGIRLSDYILTSCSYLLASDFPDKERKAAKAMVYDSTSANHNAAFALVYIPVEFQ